MVRTLACLLLLSSAVSLHICLSKKLLKWGYRENYQTWRTCVAGADSVRMEKRSPFRKIAPNHEFRMKSIFTLGIQVRVRSFLRLWTPCLSTYPFKARNYARFQKFSRHFWGGHYTHAKTIHVELTDILLINITNFDNKNKSCPMTILKLNKWKNVWQLNKSKMSS